jgi:hypothetical protein
LLEAIVQKRSGVGSNSVGFRRPPTRSSAVRGGLGAVRVRVLTALGHQLIVRADLHESGPIEHGDEIGHAHRRKLSNRLQPLPALRPTST